MSYRTNYNSFRYNTQIATTVASLVYRVVINNFFSYISIIFPLSQRYYYHYLILFSSRIHIPYTGIGYYAQFAAKISGTKCKYVYVKELWGIQPEKKGHACPNTKI